MHVHIDPLIPPVLLAHDLVPGTIFEVDWEDETVAYLKTRSRLFSGTEYVRLDKFQLADPKFVGPMRARVVGKLVTK